MPRSSEQASSFTQKRIHFGPASLFVVIESFCGSEKTDFIALRPNGPFSSMAAGTVWNGPRSKLYNSDMKSSVFRILMILGSSLTIPHLHVQVSLAQAPTNPSSVPSKSNEQSRPTLDQLPLPPDAILVITDSVRQALNQMRVGSIVLSAERYQALMDELNRLRREVAIRQADFVFASCLIRGRVTAGAKQLRAELKIELSFRTTAAEQRVPLPLSGLQLTAAELDGGLPPWQVEREQIVLLVPEPGSHRLVLEGTCILEGHSGEHRLKLERFPPALITTLELLVPGLVSQAQVRGGPRLAVEPTSAGSRLKGEGLGPLPQLDLTWRDSAAAAAPLTVTGTIRHALTEQQVDIDARLRLEGGRDAVAELRLRLASIPKDLEVEQATGEGTLPLTWSEAGPNEPDVLVIKLPQAWRAETGPLQLRLRGNFRWSGPAALGVLEVLQPSPSRQSGVVVIRASPGLPLRLLPGNVLAGDVRELPERDAAGAVQVFRYGRQPVRLEARLEPVRLEQLAEVRLTHYVRLTPGRAVLSTDLEIMRLRRIPVQEVVIAMPAGWRVDHRTATQPLVAQTEENAGRLHLKLVNRITTPFRLRIEGELVGSTVDRVNFELPSLIDLREEPGQSIPTLRIVARQERVVIEGDDVEVRLDAGTAGLIDEQNRPPSLEVPLPLPAVLLASDSSRRSPDNSSARLALFWRAKLARVSGAAEIFVDSHRMQVKQALIWHWPQRVPAQLALEVPAGVTVSPTAEFEPDSDAPMSRIHLPLSRRNRGDSATITLDIPQRVSQRSRLVVSFEIPLELDSTLMPLPMRWLRPVAAEVVWEGGWPVNVWSTRHVRLEGPAVLPSLAATAVAPQVGFRLESWEAPCPVRAARTPPRRPPAVAESAEIFIISSEEASDSDHSIMRVTWRWRLAQVHESRLLLVCPWPSERVRLHQATIDSQPIAADSLELSIDENSQLRVGLPIELSLLPRGLTVTLEGSVSGGRGQWGIKRVPNWEWPAETAMVPTRWWLRLPVSQVVVDTPATVIAYDESEGCWELWDRHLSQELAWRELDQTWWRVSCSSLLVLATVATVASRRPKTWLLIFGVLLLLLGAVRPWLLRQASLAALPGIGVTGALAAGQFWRRHLAARRPRFGVFRPVGLTHATTGTEVTNLRTSTGSEQRA